MSSLMSPRSLIEWWAVFSLQSFVAFIPSQCNLIRYRVFFRRTFYCIHQYSCQKTKRFTSACVLVVKYKTASQCMTNVMKTRRSAEGKIIAFELYYQGQITGLIPKYSFPQGLPFCSMRCQSKQLALKYRIRHGRFTNTQILRCWNIHCCSFFNKVRWLQESPHSFMHVQPQILLVFESDIITLGFFFFLQSFAEKCNILCIPALFQLLFFLLSHFCRKLFTVFTALTLAERYLLHIRF